MHRKFSHRLTAMLAIILTLAFTVASSIPAAAAGSPWTSAPYPQNLGVFHGTAIISANDVWAVGEDGAVATSLIKHWDGTKWSVIPTDATSDSLNSVAAVSTADVWAVGSGQGMIQHWNGAKWSAVPSPTPAQHGVPGSWRLDGVTAISANDVWAVGFTVGSGLNPPTYSLIEHWNGSRWSEVSSPSVFAPGFFDRLSSVAAVSAGDVWAVGQTGFGTSSGKVLVQHWNGSQWTIVPAPSATTSALNNPCCIDSSLLLGVAVVSAGDIWAVGYVRTGGNTSYTLTEHWNGTTWSIVRSPNPGDQGRSYFYGVAVVGPNDVWAVGAFGSATNFNNTLTEHWNGTSWSHVSSPGTSPLNAVAARPSGLLWAVGEHVLLRNTTG